MDGVLSNMNGAHQEPQIQELTSRIDKLERMVTAGLAQHSQWMVEVSKSVDERKEDTEKGFRVVMKTLKDHGMTLESCQQRIIDCQRQVKEMGQQPEMTSTVNRRPRNMPVNGKRRRLARNEDHSWGP